MSTLKDVAKKSGLSITTVATILRGEKSLYQPDTVERVERAAREVAYIPNHFSRNLVKGRTGILLYVLSRQGGATFNRESQLALAEAASGHGFKLLIEPVEESGRPPENAGFLTGRYFDGVIANFTSWSQADMDRVETILTRSEIPMVWFNQDRPYNSVFPDEPGDASRLAAHLYKNNFRRLLYVGHAPTHRHFSSRDRYHTFQDEWKRLGGTLSESLADLNPDQKVSSNLWNQKLRSWRGRSSEFDCVVFSHPFLAPFFVSRSQFEIPFFSFDAPPYSWGDLPMGGQCIPWREISFHAVDLLTRRIQKSAERLPSVYVHGVIRDPILGNNS